MYRYFITFLIFCSFQLFSQQKPVVVLELFTSQGCSSCPPADQVLRDIKKNLNQKEIIPIAYHVDYWDYIGWKDPFSKKSFTDKQRYYGNKFRSSSIYTPQLVINGKEHLVGSYEVSIHKKIKSYLKKSSSNSIELSNIIANNKKVSFSYTINGDISNKTLEAVLVINERTTAVNRGENRNRMLTNSNIAIQEKSAPLTKTQGTLSLSIPSIVTKEDSLRLIVLIKDNELSVSTGTQISL